MKLWKLPLHILSDTNITTIKSDAATLERTKTNVQMSTLLEENTKLASRLDFMFRTLKKMKITKGFTPPESNELLREQG